MQSMTPYERANPDSLLMDPEEKAVRAVVTQSKRLNGLLSSLRT